MSNNVVFIQDNTNSPLIRPETGGAATTFIAPVVPFVETEPLSQRLATPASPILPQTLKNANLGTGTGVLDHLDTRLFHRSIFNIQVGNLVSGGCLNAKVQSSQTGAIWNDLTGNNRAITTIITSNKIASIEVRADEMPAGQPYLRCLLSETGNQNVVCACLPQVAEAALEPTSVNDYTTVAQRLFN